MIEKRRAPRKASLDRCLLYTLGADQISVEARMLNFSGTGLLIETDCPVEVGKRCRILLDEQSSTCMALGHEFLTGTVRWCAPQKGSVGGMFDVGMEINLDASILTSIAV